MHPPQILVYNVQPEPVCQSNAQDQIFISMVKSGENKILKGATVCTAIEQSSLDSKGPLAENKNQGTNQVKLMDAVTTETST